MNHLSIEDFLINDKVTTVVNLLSKYRIKLWELKDLSLEESEKEIEELFMKISDESGLVENELKSILIRLQQHSLKKLVDNKRFSEDGIAIFKIKIIGNLNKNQQEKIASDHFEVSMHITGLELNSLIKAKFDLNCDSLKLICNGKILKEDSTLKSQEIKNHSTFIALCVYNRVSSEMTNDSAEYQLISDIKDAVEFLTDQRMKGYDIGLNEFKLSNQNGRSIEISHNDTQVLTSAIILHEKGKNLMKSKNYLKALILLAQSDVSFKNCSDKSLLERVDNYALLNLDIIWCYLNLENLHELKDAEERLRTCELCLKKCYGSDLERLSKIKGEHVNKHTPIFVRVSLLNAILQYHKGRKRECREYLDVSSRELKKINIDESKLIQVMSMGFKNTEARLALRATSNNVDESIELILKKKKQKEEAQKIEKQNERAKVLESKYGRTLNNNQIDLQLLDNLIQLGYRENKAVVALVRTNNNFQEALDLINSGELEYDILPSTSANSNEDTRECVARLLSMGFDSNMAKIASEAFNNFEKAANFLLESSHGSDAASNELLKDRIQDLLKSAKLSELEQKKDQAKDLLTKISAEMPEDDEAYLDFNTDEDSFFINKYYSLLD